MWQTLVLPEYELAPQHGLEPRTQWLIPPMAGLYRRCFKKPFDTSLFNPLFQTHRFTPGFALDFMDDLPRSFNNFGGSG